MIIGELTVRRGSVCGINSAFAVLITSLIFSAAVFGAVEGDLNGDGVCDIADMGIFADQWLTIGPDADYDSDGRVDLEDYSKLADDWKKISLPAPVSWWKLDGDITDSSGNGHHGTAVNGVDYVAGVCGQAGRWDATGDYISVPTTGFSVAAGTVALWAQQTADTDAKYFFGHSSQPSSFSSRIQIKMGNSVSGANYLRVQMGSATNTAPTIDNIVRMTVGQWFHIALTWQETSGGSGTCTVYINGDQTVVSAGYSGLSAIGIFAHIGNNGQTSAGNGPMALIDSVAVWSGALSAVQAKAVYQNCILTPPLPAGNPDPADGAVDIATSKVLSWTAGAGTSSHNVFFGTVTPPPFIGNQTAASFNPVGLSANSRYYWKIDEKGVLGSITAGAVWSFTTVFTSPPQKAAGPDPADVAINVGVDADLAWQTGGGTKSHDVYFGSTNPPPFIANTTNPVFDPGVLNYTSVYYWRINERNSAGVTTGDLWRFTTVTNVPPPKAANPVPSDGAAGIDRNTALSWTASPFASSRAVFIGTVNPPPFKTMTTAVTYQPGPLAFNTLYYWRIDEKNSYGSTAGDVWRFTTAIRPPCDTGAAAPSPANGSVGVSTTSQLSWTPCPYAVSHNIYFGTANPPPFAVNQAGSVFSPGLMSVSAVYYWRADTIGQNGTLTGSLWSFTTAASHQPPLAAFSVSPVSGAVPLAVGFTDLSAGSLTGWKWDFGDGYTSSFRGPVHVYQNTGSYTVTLTASGPTGSDTAIKTAYINVLPKPPDALFAGVPLYGFSPLDVSFDSTTQEYATSWNWTFGDGGSSTFSSPVHTYLNEGTYTVGLSVSGPGGSDSVTKTGYVRVYNGGYQKWQKVPELQLIDMRSVDISPASEVWACTYSDGIYRYSGDAWLHYEDELSSQKVYEAAFDAGSCWFATQGGLDRFNGSAWTYYNQSNSSIPGNDCRSVSVDAAGNVWVGTNGKGAARFAPSSGIWTIYNSDNSQILGDIIYDISFDSSSRVWFAVYGKGISVFDPAGGTWTSYGSRELVGTRVNAIAFDSAGTVWAATEDGLNEWHGGSSPWMVHNIASGMGDDKCFDVSADPDDFIWVGTFGGVSMYDQSNKTWAIFTTADGLSHQMVYSVTPQTSQKIWAGTQDGLCWFENIESRPIAAFEADRTVGDMPLTVNFTDKSLGSVSTRLWEFGDGQTSTQRNPSHTYSARSTYTVRLTVTGPKGTDTFAIPDMVKVSAPPEPFVSPSSVSMSVRPGETSLVQVMLTNAGEGELVYEVGTAQQGGAFGLMQTVFGSAADSGVTPDSSAVAADMFKFPHKPNRLIVKFRSDGLSASSKGIEAAMSKAGVRMKKPLMKTKKLHNGSCASSDIFLVEDVRGDLSAARDALLKDPSVEYAHPDYQVNAAVIPNDEKFGELWGMHNTGQLIGSVYGTVDADIDAVEAWDLATGGYEIIGVIDTGIDYTHPDLADNIWTNLGEIPGNGIDDDGNGYIDDIHGWDFCNQDPDPMDDHFHGTHVSGTIAGRGNNGIGVAGVNWRAKLAALKFLDSGGSGYTSDAILAIDYATKMEMCVTNNSWGGGGYEQAMKDAIDAAGAKGFLFVAAAGNSSSDNDKYPFYPAAYESDNLIAVAATDNKDGMADFSNYGRSTVDLGAPGVSVLSCWLGGTYGYAGGTSMATPHVVGAAGLLKAYRPAASGPAIKKALLDSVDVISSLNGKVLSNGRLNVYSAMMKLQSAWLLVTPTSGTVAPGASEQLTLVAYPNGLGPGDYQARVQLQTNSGLSDPSIDVSLNVSELKQLSAAPAGFDFGRVQRSTKSAMKMMLQNLGNEDVTVSSIVFTDSHFTQIAAPPLVIPAFGAMSTDVVFSPAAIGAVSGTMTVNSDSQDNPVMELPVSGEGTPIPAAAGFTASKVLGRPPMQVDFTDTSAGDLDSCNWDFGDGGTSSMKDPSHIYQSSGVYTVSLTVSGAGGTDTETKTGFVEVSESAAAISPTELVFNLVSGANSSQNLILSNTGTSQLTFAVDSIDNISTASNGFGATADEVVDEDSMFAHDYKQGELLVKIKPSSMGTQTLNGAVAAAGMRIEKVITALPKDNPSSHWLLLRSGGNADLKAVRRRLLASPDVLYVEPNYKVRTLADPNDPYFGLLWGMNNTGQMDGTADADIDAVEAWQIYNAGGSVMVGVIDTGIEYTHPDLKDNIWTNPGEIAGNGIDDDGNGYIDDIHGYDFCNKDPDPMDDHFHGTHCSGTIAGRGNNGIGVVGVVWKAKLAALKFMSAGGIGYISDAALALNYANAMNIPITSNSWGGGGYTQTMKDVIDAAGAKGFLFVAAAGNNGSNNDASPFYPACYTSANLICVAATDNTDVIADFSNYGRTTVDLGAPGVDIYSCTLNGAYRYASGTSMATPHVAGVCALLKSFSPNADGMTIKNAVLGSVDLNPSLNGKVVTNGRLNAANALLQVGGRWITVTPVSGNAAAGGNAAMAVKADAKHLFAGTYHANIRLKTNDPDGPLIEVPVTANVTGP